MKLKVLDERETLERAIAGESLARFGDGELKLALGRDCVSQVAAPRLQRELVDILSASPALVCLPNGRSAKPDSWAKFHEARYTGLYNPDATYGSAFVSRPDSAPWIDTPDYWDRVADLWRGQDVVLVAGTDRSLRPEELAEAASTRVVTGPRRDAYAEIDRLEMEIGEPAGPVILCMGATATVLAHRLAGKGVHALDLGHIGMFRRHAGAYRFTPEELASTGYRRQLAALHAKRRWGADGDRHAGQVLAYAEQLGAASILDYGCGEGRLAKALTPRRVTEYDPGVSGRDALPKPADLVVCTDVLEHVEPDRLDAVLRHIRRLAARGAYLVIATRPAQAVLPDGRNAHLIVRPAEWWLDRLSGLGWIVERADHKPGHDLTAWVRA